MDVLAWVTFNGDKRRHCTFKDFMKATPYIEQYLTESDVKTLDENPIVPPTNHEYQKMMMIEGGFLTLEDSINQLAFYSNFFTKKRVEKFICDSLDFYTNDMEWTALIEEKAELSGLETKIVQEVWLSRLIRKRLEFLYPDRFSSCSYYSFIIDSDITGYFLGGRENRRYVSRAIKMLGKRGELYLPNKWTPALIGMEFSYMAKGDRSRVCVTVA